MTTDPLQPLMDALRSAWPQADPSSLVTVADQLLRGQAATLGASTASLTFGQGNDFRDATVTIGNIVGGNMTTTNLTINFSQSINPQAAILQQLLYHHESATIFANRLDGFVGREAEIVEIRDNLAKVMPSGGYITITAQAGEGKSSVIAQMVSQDGPDQAAFHFIALTPGREYQLSLLRPIVARLILKHGLPTTYFPGESYPAMRDYFHSVLRQLSERGIQDVIYIDGLDQLEAEADGTRDLSFLPNSPPPGIVLVLGTRPDDTLHPLEGKKVQVEYRLPHLSYPDFQHLLMHQGVVTPAAHQLYTALQGNAFYLGLIVQELKAGPIADLDAFVERISDNPDNLFGFTINRLRRADRTLWKDVLQLMLTLLLVAQEPLGIAAIRHLLDAEDGDVRTALQRLGGLVAQDSEGRSFLYHLKVREYLQEDPAQPEQSFVVSQGQIEIWHRKLTAWCVRDASDIVRIWDDTTGLEQTRRWYARQHYVTHLILGKQWDQLGQVINDGTYGRHKRRFDPSTHLYTRDLDQARDAAVEAQDLVNLWRWSLLRVSLTSQIDAWPDELFVALVHLGREGEALNRAELLSDSGRKVEVLAQLAPLFDVATAQRIWDRAHTAATAIIHVGSRTRALFHLAAAQIQAGLWDNASTTAAAITDAENRARILCDLAEAQAESQHPGAAATFALAAATIDSLPYDSQRPSALFRLAAAQSQTQHPDAAATFALAAATIDAIDNQRARAYALSILAAAQSQAQHPDATATFALAAATTDAIDNQRARNYALSTLAAAQVKAGLWTEAQTTAAAITDEVYHARALSALAKAQTKAGLWTEAQTTAFTINIKVNSAYALRDLAQAQAKAGLWAEAQTIATIINHETVRVSALCQLAGTQTEAQHPDATATFALVAATIDSLPYDSQRSSALSTLAAAQAQARHPDAAATFDLATTATAAITNTREHASVLSHLAAAQIQAGLWDDASTTAAAITDAENRAHVLCDLAEAQAEAQHPGAAATFALAAATIDVLPYDSQRPSALFRLAAAQSQAQHPDAAATFALVTATTDTITDVFIRAGALMDLARVQAQAQHPDAAATFALAAATTDAIPNILMRSASRQRLAVFQAETGFRWEATIGTDDDRARAASLSALHSALSEAGSIPAVRQSVMAVWRGTTTRTELLTLAAIAHPLLSTDPDLGQEIVAAFAWVDDQLREE
jgi:hypothetical protein